MVQILSDLETVRFNEQADGVIILGQTLLPDKEAYLALTTAEEVRDAVYRLKVCGAPAIGIAVAYDIYVCVRRIDMAGRSVFVNEFRKIKEYLIGSCPIVVNLVATLNRMERVLVAHPILFVPEWEELLYKEAITIWEEDAAACWQAGKNCPELFRFGTGILTHYSAGHLAVSEYGTVLAPIYLGQERGYGFKIFAGEIRPLLQGARFMAHELNRTGVGVILICDNMASIITREGWVHAVVVGHDRVVANDDVANKIGTSEVATLARHYKIPSYVLSPTPTTDGSYPDGDSIVIEKRNPDEATEIWYLRCVTPRGIKVCNLVFDITPHELVATIITGKGIFYKNNR